MPRSGRPAACSTENSATIPKQQRCSAKPRHNTMSSPAPSTVTAAVPSARPNSRFDRRPNDTTSIPGGCIGSAAALLVSIGFALKHGGEVTGSRLDRALLLTSLGEAATAERLRSMSSYREPSSLTTPCPWPQLLLMAGALPWRRSCCAVLERLPALWLNPTSPSFSCVHPRARLSSRLQLPVDGEAVSR
jgi:hypothetical protein